MSTVNMKKVGDTYEQDMDPFAEYQHKPEPKTMTVPPKIEATVQPKRIDVARKQMHQVVDHIDEAIEGAELMFEFGDMLIERLRRF